MQPLEQLDQLGPILGDAVSGIGPDQLDAPTPCADFSVRGVLEHMISGATMFAAAFRGEPAPTEGAGAAGDPVEGFGAAITGLVEAIQSPGALDRRIEVPFGTLAGHDFARFVVLDGLVHGWDLTTATGHPYAPPESLVTAVDAFARQTITSDMREAGMFGHPTDPPTDATPIERLVAFTGRTVTRAAA